MVTALTEIGNITMKHDNNDFIDQSQKAIRDASGKHNMRSFFFKKKLGIGTAHIHTLSYEGNEELRFALS